MRPPSKIEWQDPGTSLGFWNTWGKPQYLILVHFSQVSWFENTHVRSQKHLGQCLSCHPPNEVPGRCTIFTILLILWNSEQKNGLLIKLFCFSSDTIFTILLTLWNSEQKNGLLIKLFCFSSDFDETYWSFSYPCVL